MISMRQLLLFPALLVTSTQAFAHDFSSGPNMGLPPKAAAVKSRLGDLVPAGGDDGVVRRVRGVIDRAKMWPMDSTLVICFRDGTQKARARIARMASEWTQYVGLRLDFGDMASPRACSGKNTEEIKVDFYTSGPNAGHWSYIGVDSRQFAHSLNLAGFGSDALPVPEPEYRRIVLHEFGHALGFEHEHQSPAAHCEAEFDKDKLKAWANRMQWNAQDVQTNLADLQPSTSRVFTRHDTKSIMHYSLPEELFRGGKTNKCWVDTNASLSEGDKAFAAQMYPQRVATRGAITRSITDSPREAEANFRNDLAKDYEDALTKGGTPKDRVAKLVADFKKELARVRSGATPVRTKND